VSTITDLRNGIAAALMDEPRRLAIVFYHVAQGAEQPFLRLQGPEAPDYSTCIRVAVKAVKRIHPEALIVMMTDDATEIDTTLPMKIVRLPVKPEWLMYERTRCQLAFTQAYEAQAIHIDTDVILRKSFNTVLGWPVDFVLTDRFEIPGQHINGGMLICKSPRKFAHFLTDLLKMYDAIALAAESWAPWDLHCFRGGQLSLATLMFDKFYKREPHNPRKQPDPYHAHKTPWGIVGIAPAETINWTLDPNNVNQDALAWHLKGVRKMFLPMLEAEITKTGAKFNAA